jgi:hypothetical protein
LTFMGSTAVQISDWMETTIIRLKEFRYLAQIKWPGRWRVMWCCK